MFSRVVIALALISCCAAFSYPDPIILNAPFTPFYNNGSVNVQAIPALGKFAKSVGVNTVWAPGGLGQFETLTLAERKALAEQWIATGKQNGIFIIVHVGTSVQADAIELAAHALANGADAIASVPPYYENCGSPSELAAWLQPILAAASPLPFFYYHIPGSTGCNLAMSQFWPVATKVLPTLAGIKFVSSDFSDWMTLTQTYDTSKYAFMFAPEPKIAGLPMGARHVILAEDFYAQTWIRMYNAFQAGNIAEAQREQMWKLGVMNVFNNFGGVYGERYVYRQLIGVDLGPPRNPGTPLSDTQVTSMFAALQPLGFFNQTMVELSDSL